MGRGRMVFPVRSAAVLVALGLGLVLVSWMGATVPFDGPDEPSHFDRALTLVHGRLIGVRSKYLPNPGLSPTQLAFIDHDTTKVLVPRRLMAPNVECIDGRPNTGSCWVATPVGNFEPLGYVLPAAGIALAQRANGALWFARFGSVIQTMVFLALAVWLLWGGSLWSLLGLLLAVTPMVFFSGSVLNLSGIEIASCLAFVAAVCRITRPGPVEVRVWAAAALSGAVGLLTGPADLAFIGLDCLLFLGLTARDRLGEFARTPPARVAAAVVFASAILSFIYSRVAGFSTRFGISPLGSSLRGGWDQLGSVLHVAVGNFGALTVPLPDWMVWLWLAMVAAVSLLAMAMGAARQRLVVAVTFVVALAFPVLFWAWMDRWTGFGLDGREVLPELMMIPLVSGEVVFRNRDRLPAEIFRATPVAVVSVIAILHLYAWFLSARAAAGQPDDMAFWTRAHWAPPLGWWPWIVASLVGAGMLAAAAETDRHRRAHVVEVGRALTGG
jgi:hypothetical protein